MLLVCSVLRLKTLGESIALGRWSKLIRRTGPIGFTLGRFEGRYALPRYDAETEEKGEGAGGKTDGQAPPEARRPEPFHEGQIEPHRQSDKPMPNEIDEERRTGVAGATKTAGHDHLKAVDDLKDRRNSNEHRRDLVNGLFVADEVLCDLPLF